MWKFISKKKLRAQIAELEDRVSNVSPVLIELPHPERGQILSVLHNMRTGESVKIQYVISKDEDGRFHHRDMGVFKIDKQSVYLGEKDG